LSEYNASPRLFVVSVALLSADEVQSLSHRCPPRRFFRDMLPYCLDDISAVFFKLIVLVLSPPGSYHVSRLASIPPAATCMAGLRNLRSKFSFPCALVNLKPFVYFFFRRLGFHPAIVPFFFVVSFLLFFLLGNGLTSPGNRCELPYGPVLPCGLINPFFKTLDSGLAFSFKTAGSLTYVFRPNLTHPLRSPSSFQPARAGFPPFGSPRPMQLFFLFLDVWSRPAKI